MCNLMVPRIESGYYPNIVLPVYILVYILVRKETEIFMLKLELKIELKRSCMFLLCHAGV